MEFSWQVAKDAFFSLGSLAGLVALLRPIFESKHELDRERLSEIFEVMSEREISELSRLVWRERKVPSKSLDKLYMLERQIASGSKAVRFSSMLRKWYLREVEEITRHTDVFLADFGAPYWTIAKADSEAGGHYYCFNKSEFNQDHDDSFTYRDYLSSLESHILRIQECYRRLEVISELHFLESMFAFALLPRRFARVKILA